MPDKLPAPRGRRLLCLIFASFAAGSGAALPGVALAAPAEAVPAQTWAESSWLELAGTRVHYLRLLPESRADSGPGSRADSGPGSGQAKGRVLLIHGFGASVYCWSALAPALAREGYEVVAVDWPPFGWSESPETELEAALASKPGQARLGPGPGRPEAKASLLWSFLDALDCSGAPWAGPWILVGHSLGGRIASWMAGQRPSSTQALVLLAPASLGAVGSPGLASSDLFASLLGKNLPAYLANPAKIASALGRAYGRKPLPEEVLAYQAPLTRPGASRELIAWARTASEKAEPPLGRITSPCLILWGTADRIVRNQGKRLASRIGASTYIAYPGAGHVLMETEGATVEKDILAFLSAGRP